MANLKNQKKGDKVILRLFTGAFVGAKEIVKADANFIYLETRVGLAKFSRKTGKQVDPQPKNEKYASYIEEYDEAVEAEGLKKRGLNTNGKKAEAAKPAKKVTKKAAKVEEPEEIEDDEEDEEEEAPTPKKKAVKKVAKKPAKKVVEEDDDDDDFEEME